MKESLKAMLNEIVVVDTRSEWIYIGTLRKVTEDALFLIDADVHTGADSGSTKEMYIYESRKNGVQVNRKEVFVNIKYVVSVSPFTAIRQFV